MHLSKKTVESFVGDVLPISLIFEKFEDMGRVSWSVDSDAVAIKGFDGGEWGFSHGVLLVLMRVGEATVTASCDGCEYTARVTVREREEASDSDAMNYYVGDLHDHTSMIHDQALFAVRETDFPIDCINFVKNENLLDFSVISDHGDVITKKDFFRGFTDAEEAQPMELVVFPGSESEVTFIEEDRFGLKRKNSGEIVVLNAAGYSAATTWQEFYDDMASSPLPVGTFAHPQVIGYGDVGGGIWNFKFAENNTPELLRMMRLVEMGNGGDRNENLVHEYAYSQALDAGFSVSVSCSSDSHGPEWGYRCFPGKTVIMSPKKSKEYFLDALLKNRVYASESGNLKLDIRVNGNPIPCRLSPDTERYDFVASVSYFKNDSESVPKKCTVVSDKGNTVAEFHGDDLSSLNFSITSQSARYFYLRFVDGLGRKTWSPPVFCGREFDKYEQPKGVAVDKSEIVAHDEVSGLPCDALISGDPREPWLSTEKTASIVMDLGCRRRICALGHYAYHFVIKELREKGIPEPERLKSFVSRYRIGVSLDGKEYTTVAEGKMRAFGGEEFLSFPENAARFIKFEALSTVGYESDVPKYMDAPISIGELSVFENK